MATDPPPLPAGTPLPPGTHLSTALELPIEQQVCDAQAQQLPAAPQPLPSPDLPQHPDLPQQLDLPQHLESLAPEHLEACLQLDGLALNGLWSRRQWSVELADPQRPGLGIWQRRQLLAMACSWLILDELHITLVTVDPSQRRRGLGRRVLEALMQEGRRLGALRATLEVASGNQAAQSLYASLGFEVAGCRRGYYSNGEDALIEWVKLRA